jgi:hypothetical protein
MIDHLIQYFLSVSTVSYEQSAITYVWKNDEATLRKSPSLTTLNAYLITNQTVQCEVKGSWRGLSHMLIYSFEIF